MDQSTEIRLWLNHVRGKLTDFVSANPVPAGKPFLVVLSQNLAAELSTERGKLKVNVKWFSRSETFDILNRFQSRLDAARETVTEIWKRGDNDGQPLAIVVTSSGFLTSPIPDLLRPDPDADLLPVQMQDVNDDSYSLTPAAMLRLLYESEATGSTNKRMRQAATRFKARVDAARNAETMVGREPNLDIIIARVGNLSGFIRALDQQGIENVDVVPFLTGESVS